MDLNKTGNLIQQKRKEKNLTQLALAQKLYVSEKTISKWECGKGFPDTSIILPLCEILGISANELLSGKTLSTNQEYKEQAELNLLNLKQVQEKNAKFLLSLEYIIGFFSVAFLLSIIVIASHVAMSDALRIILCLAALIPTIIGIHFCLIIERDAGFYECSCCHHKYIPTYKQMLWSMHMGRTRFMKCPKCNKKSWCKKTIKK